VTPANQSSSSLHATAAEHTEPTDQRGRSPSLDPPPIPPPKVTKETSHEGGKP